MMRGQKEQIKAVARERIRILLEHAGRSVKKNAELSRRYVELARRVGMRAGVTIPQPYKYFICKGCATLLIPGHNVRVRTRSEPQPRVVITCLRCGHRRSRSIMRERRKRRLAV